MRVALSASLLVLVGLVPLLPAQPQDRKEKPTAETVTVEELRAQVGKYLADKGKRAVLAEYRKKVRLGTKGITYKKKKDGRFVCRWTVVLRPRVKLTPAARKALEEGLTARLSDAINQYRDGILSSDENIDFEVKVRRPRAVTGGTGITGGRRVIKRKKEVRRVGRGSGKETRRKQRNGSSAQSGGSGGNETRPTLPPPTQAAAPRSSVWYFLPAPCGSCFAGWFYSVEAARPAAPAAAQQQEAKGQTKGQAKARRAAGSRRTATARGAAPRPRRAATARAAAPVQRLRNIAAVSAQQAPAPERRRVAPASNALERSPAPVQSTEVVARAAPRRPVKLPPLSTERLTAKDAPELFWQGYRLYWGREYAEALTYFEAATRLAPDDARPWYYRALAERALEDHESAGKSRQRAVDLHQRGKPRADLVGLALERVQGPLRRWLREGDSAPTRRLAGR
jgi:hypothetical protein